MLRLERALVSFDLETTGLDVGKDRIVEIGMVRVERDGTRREWVQRVNPGIPIPREATAVHGIRDEDVREMPSFSEVASTVVEMMMDADLAGYNSNRFDVPMLAEELLRAGHPFDISDRRCVDAMVIFMKHEERTLEAAMRFYCGKEIPKAHCALDDARAMCFTPRWSVTTICRGMWSRWRSAANSERRQILRGSCCTMRRGRLCLASASIRIGG